MFQRAFLSAIAAIIFVFAIKNFVLWMAKGQVNDFMWGSFDLMACLINVKDLLNLPPDP